MKEATETVLSFLFHLGFLETGLLIAVLAASMYALFYYKRSKTIISSIQKSIMQETKKVVYDDGLLSEKRLRPIYNKISKKVGQSMVWLEKKAKKTGIVLRRDKLSKGDGLTSIFSRKNIYGSSPGFEGGVRGLIPSSLDDHQRFAFAALYEGGVFEGADISVLRDICCASTHVDLKAGHTLFDSDSLSGEFLFILKSGSCGVLYSDDSSLDASENIHELKPGAVIASQVDIIAWITGFETKRCVSVVAHTDSVVLQIPSPRKNGEFKTGLHASTLARSVRMLLVKINRTTVATALFHLGLAEHMLPHYRPLNLPQKLVEFFDNIKERHVIDQDDLKSITPLVKTSMASLYGFMDDKEIEVTLELAASGAPSTPVRRTAAGAPSLPGDKPGPAPSKQLAVGSSSQAAAKNKGSASRLNLLDLGEESSSPVAFTRSLSFDSSIKATPDIMNLEDNVVKDTVIQQRSIQTRLVCLRKGQSIVDADTVPGLYVILSGRMALCYCGKYGQENAASLIGQWKRKRETMVVSAGSVVGHVALFSGNSEGWYGRKGNKNPPLMTALVESDTCWLLGIAINSYLRELVNRPSVIFHISNRLIEALPPVLRLFDFCIKWKKVESGESIVVKGQPPTGELLVLLFGRLGVATSDPQELEKSSSSDYLWTTPAKLDGVDVEADTLKKVAHAWEPEYLLGKGALIGEAQLLTGENFNYSVRAMRQSSLAVVPLSLLNYISQQYVTVFAYIARNVSHKQDLHLHQSVTSTEKSSQSIMLLPISGSIPFDLVCSTLRHCVGEYVSKVRFFSSADVAAVFGGSPESIPESELFMTIGSWLHEVEVDADLVVFQADWQFTAWNRLISSMCDEIVLIANAIDDSELSEVEERLNERYERLPKTLVMLYINPAANQQPSATRKWIERRNNVERHIHVRLNSRHLPFEKYHYRSDFHRLARILTNNAVGLVLGGGGARGISHLGIIQAIEERGIPIDFIGGTSIGSFMGGLYACEQSYIKIEPIARRYADKLASVWFHVQDLTLPITSYFNGYNFMRAIRDIFGERKIEDFWLNYYCITTDLSTSQQLIHVNGTASRYIRASMSLANYFPPVCDVDKNKELHFLVDGGYTNCVPVDIMKERFGARLVFAVDVSSNWKLDADHNYGDMLNGLSVLLSKWNPWGSSQLVFNCKVPSMADIGDQLAFISATEQMKRAKTMANLFMGPPVKHYTALDFSKFDEIRQIGLSYGREQVNDWYDNFMLSEESENFKWLGKSGKKIDAYANTVVEKNIVNAQEQEQNIINDTTFDLTDAKIGPSS